MAVMSSRNFGNDTGFILLQSAFCSITFLLLQKCLPGSRSRKPTAGSQ